MIEDGNEVEDIIIIGLHLKSQQKYVHNHMAAVATLLGFLSDSALREASGLPEVRKEKDVVILGDLNDSAHKRHGFKYLFDYLEGVDYVHLHPDSGTYPLTRVGGSQIDHIFVSSGLEDIINGDSFKVHYKAGISNSKYRKDYSDHYPVTVNLVFD
ncbi:hypothetical protein [Agarilytica rhodophyticola]|uniref:hypothetical protein n=1 Tax=Agarilytica rhodophyticola TaxID=1737490 RepID=UPI000B3475F1|nr:hypothetical protein [Agarilytica rhodophyticola]